MQTPRERSRVTSARCGSVEPAPEPGLRPGGLMTFEEGAAFREALRRFSRRTDEICRKHGLTVQQYTLLLLIKGAPGGREESTVTALAERLQLAHNGIAERIQRAEAAGLVRRRRSREDGRVSLIRLTAEGERRLLRAFAELGGEAARLVEFVEGVRPAAEPSRAAV